MGGRGGMALNVLLLGALTCVISIGVERTADASVGPTTVVQGQHRLSSEISESGGASRLDNGRRWRFAESVSVESVRTGHSISGTVIVTLDGNRIFRGHLHHGVVRFTHIVTDGHHKETYRYEANAKYVGSRSITSYTVTRGNW